MTGRILPVILAAGRASRFNGEKLGRECAGRPVGSWVIGAFENADSGHGVVIAREAMPDFVRGTGWDVVVNDAPERGIGYSIALAARAAEDQDAAGVLIALGDMPLVPEGHFRQMFTEALRGAAIVATRYPGGALGVPASFAAELFGELAMLDGDRGAADLLHRNDRRVMLTANPDWLVDVDTVVGLRRAESLLNRREGRL